MHSATAALILGALAAQGLSLTVTPSGGIICRYAVSCTYYIPMQ